ncbi:hypothetical protein C0Q70_14718 [Pomacea canaliculata]|uniref:Proteasome subunit beta n=2 Tax=Pomacea canaliculata TaxID=400727 RepID=A0A2T7NSU0_POMCA|nr:hypothetical protein C0Q70_14718 [Pomacea canaliculata]
MMMAAVGQAGDTVMFTELIGKNLQLYKMKNGYEMSLHAAVNFTRRILAEMLRSQKPKMVNLLMAGVDEGGPALYFIDYIATMVKLPFAVHGYGGMFTMSILDKYYKPGMQRTEALNLLKMCMNEIQTRFVIDTPRFMVRVVTAKGVEDLGLVDPKAKGTI